MAVGVRVLGMVDVVTGDEVHPIGRPQVRQLLAILAVAGGEWVAGDTIQDDLWPATPPRSPRAALHVVVNRARDALGAGGRDALVSASDAYRLDTHRCLVDLLEWQRHVDEAERQARTGEYEVALAQFESARALWRGSPLSGVGESARLDQERRRLAIARTDAELAELNLLVAVRRANSAATRAMALLARENLREDVIVAAVRALDLASRRADALRAAADYRARLRDELGLSPSAAFDAAELAVLTGSARRRDDAPVASRREELRPLHGRDAERRAIDAVIAEGITSVHGATVVVHGDPGIGVSAFLRDVVTRWERMPRGPIVRWVAPRGIGPASMRHLVGLDAPRPSEGQAGEHVRAAAAMAEQARHDGLLVVIDDADDLDQWSQALLASLATSATPRTVVVLGRGTERFGTSRVSMLQLDPLDEAAVLEIVGRRWPDVAPGRLHRWAHHLYRWCGGNPMWTEQVIQDADLDLDPAELVVPRSAQASVRRRLAELPVAIRDLLQVAAVLGPEVDPQVVAAVVDRPVDAVVSCLSQTLLADVLAWTTPGRWRFRHELVQQAIAASVAPIQAARWHAVAGRVLYETPGRRHEAARHLAAGVPHVPADLAYRSALDAATQLREAGSYAEAARLFHDAARLATDGPARHAAALQEADALERLGDRAAASLVYDELVAQTADTGSVDVLVQAALGGTSHSSAIGGRDDRRSRLRIAWRRVPSDHPRFDSLGVELALEILNARQTPDEELLAHVRRVARDPASPAHLLARRFCLADAEIEGRATVDDAARLVAAALAPGTVPFVASACLAVAIGVALGAGAWTDAEGWIDEMALLGSTSGEPRAQWQSVAFRSVLLEGRGLCDDADHAAGSALELGRRLEMADAEATFALHQLGRAYRSGSMAVLAPALAAAADRYRFPVWSTLRGLAELDAGHTGEARTLLRRSLPDVLEDRYHFRVATLATATLLAARVGDLAALPDLERALAGRAGRLVMLGYGGPCLGPVDWYRAQAAAARGRTAEAEQLVQQGIATCRAAGARSWTEVLTSRR